MVKFCWNPSRKAVLESVDLLNGKAYPALTALELSLAEVLVKYGCAQWKEEKGVLILRPMEDK